MPSCIFFFFCGSQLLSKHRAVAQPFLLLRYLLKLPDLVLNVHDLKLKIIHDIECFVDFLPDVFHGVLVILFALLDHFRV